MTRLVTVKGRLPQGAPTSSALLNLVLAEIDELLTHDAAQVSANFTRYVDDLTFSAHVPLDSLLPVVARRLSRLGLRLNSRKIHVLGPDEPHEITGIIVGSTLGPRREFLRGLRRALSRMSRGDGRIRAEVVIGKVNWVRRLNPALAANLSKSIRV